MSKAKLSAARWLYRWGLAMGIIGTIFTTLTFIGVYFVVFGPALISLGMPSWAVGWFLAGLTLTVVLGFGLYLDKAAKFWMAQATIGTTRNQYLVDALYQKELLKSKYVDLPIQKALLYLLLKSAGAEVEASKAGELVDRLVAGILKNEESIKTHKWAIEPDEKVY